MDTRQAQSRVGEVIDRYRLDGVLGAGGFGAVFRAQHQMMQRPVALKLLHGDLGSREEIYDRFLREARTLARLGHPNIVSVHDCGIANGELFLAMELLEGEDLAARLDRTRTIGAGEALGVIEAVLSGLAAAHRAGVVHRDLKPANVFLARTPEAEVVKLVDFGISKIEGDRMTRTGVVLGTPVYMAPECVLGGAAAADARADLYAVGVILYELLSGRLPYDAPSYEGLVVKLATELPTPFGQVVPSAPPELAALVDRAIARRPDDRFVDAIVMRDAVLRVRASVAAALPNPSIAFARTEAPFPTPIPATVSSSHATAAPLATPRPFESAHIAPSPTPSGRGLGVAIASLGAAFLLLVGSLAAFALYAARDASRPPPMALAPIAPTPPVALPPSTPPLPPKPIVTPPSVATPPASTDGVEAPAGSAVPSSTSHVSSGRPVHVREPRVVGNVPIRGVHKVIDAARPALRRCRTDGVEEVHVNLHVHDGRITLAGPNPNVASSDPDVARCVGNVLRSHGPFSGGQGIVQISVELAPR